MTRLHTALTILLVCVITAGCASTESVRALSTAQRAAIEELSLAWAADHALARAELDILVSIRLTALRGRIHRELLETACIDPDGEPDTFLFAAAIADPACDIALVREVRLGRMTEAQADAWLTDYSVALRLGNPADGAAVREKLLAQLADIESITSAWSELHLAFDARAERVMHLAHQAAGASDDLADAIESRIAWRTLGADAAPEAIEPFIDAIFTDESRRAAAKKLLERLLGATDT